MKRQIRSGLFETNSSSSHSLQIIGKPNYSYKLNNHIDRNNELHVGCEEFGWEVHKYNDVYTKLQYAIQMVYETELDPDTRWDRDENRVLRRLYDAKGFKEIEKVVTNYVSCEKIVVDFCSGFYPFGYIDHQSCEDFESLDDFLDYYSVSLVDFIFDSSIWLFTDNDNH